MKIYVSNLFDKLPDKISYNNFS